MMNLEACVSNPDRPEPRAEVMKASTVAGMAFGNADVGAVHCLSESIGGVFDHAHGLLNAILLEPVLRYELEAIGDRLDSLALKLGISEGAFLSRIRALTGRLGIASFDTLNVPGESFDVLSEMAVQNGSNHANRMALDASDYTSILSSLS